MDNKFFNGNFVYISLGHATAHCMVGVFGIGATIVQTSAKAIKLEAETQTGKTISCWLPKKALVKDRSDDETINCSLAPWFKPRDWTECFLDLAQSHSVISA